MNREKAEQVKAGLTKYFEEVYETTPDFFMADYNHEEIREGAWSIAWEGWSDMYGESWVQVLPRRSQYDIYGIPDDVLLEPIYSWCLGVYDWEV